MSEPLHIALVAEGPTDYVIIEAALRAILTQAFVLTTLQPEATRPQFGEGWCGVLKWCDDTGRRHGASLDDDPLLENFDLLIIHLDLDVSRRCYRDGGQALVERAIEQVWNPLPCAQPCPPVADSAEPLQAALMSWLAPAVVGSRTVLCLPAQSSGTWLAMAVLPPDHPSLTGAECNTTLESRLAQLPLAQRIRKSTREYRNRAHRVTARWPDITERCRQAQAFGQALRAAL